MLLGYTEWRNFLLVADKARIACRNAGQSEQDNFVDVIKMVGIGSGTFREINDLALIRVARARRSVLQNSGPQDQPSRASARALQVSRRSLATNLRGGAGVHSRSCSDFRMGASFLAPNFASL